MADGVGSKVVEGKVRDGHDAPANWVEAPRLLWVMYQGEFVVGIQSSRAAPYGQVDLYSQMVFWQLKLPA